MHEIIPLMKHELSLIVILFILLAMKLGKGPGASAWVTVVQVLLLLNFVAGFFFNTEGHLFDDMYQTNSLLVLQKNILNAGLLMIALLFTEWLIKCDHLPEFILLMLSAQLGMFYLLSSGNLLMFYLSLELATIPVAAIANFHLDKKASSEAAMKMILSSAFSSGVLLFGISLMYGVTGTLTLAEIPTLLNDSPLTLLAFAFMFTAFAFKLSVVPFHLWTADVYEGAPIAVTAFLSVISKGAIAFVMVSTLYKVFQPYEHIWYSMIMVLSVLTMITGNLFALRQQQIKRFLAFSSIAQVGFILVGMSSNAIQGVSSVIYFVLIYLFSNLAAFSVVGLISIQAGKENIDDYKGFYKTNPFLSWIMALALFSLAGIPPTAGFFGKLFLLTSGALKGSYLFIGIAAINMIISLYYYLRVVRVMFIDKSETPIAPIAIMPATRVGLFVSAAAMVIIGLIGCIYDSIQSLIP
jgi:NADH-quinone oxidoreductase subunit N